MCFYVPVCNYVVTTIVDNELKFLANSDAYKDFEDLILWAVDAIQFLAPSTFGAPGREFSKQLNARIFCDAAFGLKVNYCLKIASSAQLSHLISLVRMLDSKSLRVQAGQKLAMKCASYTHDKSKEFQDSTPSCLLMTCQRFKALLYSKRLSGR